MSNMQELKKGIQTALSAARDIAAKAEGENRDFTAEERETVAKCLKDANELKGQLKQAKSDADMVDQIGRLGEGIEFDENGSKRRGPTPAAAEGTIGERFVKSAEWQAFMKRFPGGRIPEATRGLSASPVGFKTLLTGDSSSSVGAFVVPEQTGIYEGLGRYPLTLRQLLSNRKTGSDTVEFVRQVTQVNAAAPVPEANVTTYTGATGQVSGEKPEGGMTFERVSEAVKTLAVWIPATKRALSDAAQLRGLIDQELREDLNEELEEQILSGDGTGENFTGLYNTAGTLTQAYTTDIPTTTRKALTNLMTNGKQRPSAWLMHPADWETIELLKDANDRYYWGGPINRGPATLWGVPVVQSFYATEGLPILGNFNKAVLWDREQANISVSDSHSDFFIRNMIAVLAEMRAAFGVIRPSAFVEVDLTA